MNQTKKDVLNILRGYVMAQVYLHEYDKNTPEDITRLKYSIDVLEAAIKTIDNEVSDD